MKNSPRLRRRFVRRLAIPVTAALLLALALVHPGLANLAGSPFDAGDGNLVLNDEAQDWANAPNLKVGLDKPTGQQDDSFGQGTKEDTAAPTVVNGSIPNNKSDLLRFYVANQRVSGKEFLYLAWERVQEPNGTTNMDFEFNQSTALSSNGVTPVRTAGDILIKYDLAQGGTNPVLGFHSWVTTGNAATVCEASNTVPCWGKVQPLAGNFEGSINDPSNNPPTGSVVDPIPPGNPRTLSPRTFGEAAINLTDSGILPAGTCKAFSGAYLKSRASDSFTAAVKDFVAPIPVSISNCGRIIIRKLTVPSPDPTDATFNYSTTGGLNPASFGLKNGQSQDYGPNVQAGSYSVTEADPSPNFNLESIDCSASSLGHGSTFTTDTATRSVSIDLKAEDVVDCTFTNSLRLGAIKIHKTTSKDGGDLAGAQFDIRKAADSSLVQHVTTDANGVACVDNLLFGDYTVNETDAPPGYKIDDPTTHTVTVDNVATCGSGNKETLSFSDTPLSRITVSFESLAPGNPTSATVQCTGEANPAPLPEGSPKTLDNLVPGTYTCTVVVDP